MGTSIPWPAVVCLLSMMGALYILWQMWEYREQPGARYWSAAAAGMALWTGSYGVGLLVFDPAVRYLLEGGVWTGKILGPPAILGIGLVYTGRAHLAYARFMTVNIGFWLGVALVYSTNPIHHLTWTNYRITPVLNVATVSYTAKPLLFVFYGLAYVQIGIGSMLLLESIYKYGSAYRRQLFSMVIAILLPVATSLLWLFRLGPFPELNLTPVAFTCTILVTRSVLFDTELFEVPPSIVRNKAIEDLPDPFLAVDSDGQLVDFNPAAEQRIEGITDAHLGEPLSTVSPKLATRLAEQPTADRTVAIQTDEGTQYFDVNTSPYRGPRKKTQGKQITLRNVTRLKEREQALREREQDLKRQNERLSRFASVVSHDLRNPLAVVSGNVELARQQPTDERFDEIEAGLDRMDSIIDDVLTMARQKQTIKQTDCVALDTLCRDAWNNVETNTATITIQTEHVIECDQTRLLQVFENLFRNACEHNDPPLTVRVGVFSPCVVSTPEQHPNGIFIEDDGSGIPPDKQNDIFEYGYTTSDNGTGLGLSIVQEIIVSHGWEITVTNTTTGGARFEITGPELEFEPEEQPID